MPTGPLHALLDEFGQRQMAKRDEPTPAFPMVPTRLVVLDGVLIYVANEAMSLAALERISEQLRHAVPGYRVIVLADPAEIVDMRGDNEARDLALALLARLDAVVC